MHALTCSTLHFSNRAWAKKCLGKISKQLTLTASVGHAHHLHASVVTDDKCLPIKHWSSNAAESEEMLQAHSPCLITGFDADNKSDTVSAHILIARRRVLQVGEYSPHSRPHSFLARKASLHH